MKKSIAPLLALSLATGAATFAFADDDQEMIIARQLIKQSGITAEKAIDIAKKQVNGVVYQYELEDDDDQFLHEVKLINVDKNEQYKFKIDVQTGTIVKESTERAQGWFENDKKLLAAKAIEAAGFSVKDAITKVRAEGDALILEVEYEAKQGINFFEVETLDGNGEYKWLIDIDKKSIIPGFDRNH